MPRILVNRVIGAHFSFIVLKQRNHEVKLPLARPHCPAMAGRRRRARPSRPVYVVPNWNTAYGWFTLASGRPVSGPIRARTGPEGSSPPAARTWNWWTGPDLVWMLAGRPRVPDPRLTPAVHSSRPGRGTSTEAHTNGHTNGWTPASHLRRSASVWMMEGNRILSF